MTEWWLIGITVGIGVAAGIAFAGALAGLRFGFASSLLGAVLVGIVAGLLVNGWTGGVGGVVGGIVGSVSAAAVVRGAARRGATTGGTAFLLLGVAVVVGLLALIPVVGYHRGGRASRPRRAAGTAAARRSTPVSARSPSERREATDPRRHRRPHAVDARRGDRLRRDADARCPRGAGCLPARHIRLPVADPCLPLVDRDRRPR